MITQSYKKDYLDRLTDSHIVRASTGPKQRPDCPQCGSKKYVTHYDVGYRGADSFEIKKGDPIPTEEVHGPYTCLYEGYDWDCSHCMIIFGENVNIIDKMPIFITGNKHKAEYLSRQLGMDLEHRSIDLLELQSTDLHEIVEHKLQQAYEACQQPVLVEDVSLECTALGGLPGPYIKWFMEQAGNEACCRMLDGFEDRSATIKCTFGYYDSQRIEYFDSTLQGTIAQHSRGANGFGFDSIFVHQGDSITRAEMSQEDNERTYAELMKPYAQVRDFLKVLR